MTEDSQLRIQRTSAGLENAAYSLTSVPVLLYSTTLAGSNLSTRMVQGHDLNRQNAPWDVLLVEQTRAIQDPSVHDLTVLLQENTCDLVYVALIVFLVHSFLNGRTAHQKDQDLEGRPKARNLMLDSIFRIPSFQNLDA